LWGHGTTADGTLDFRRLNLEVNRVQNIEILWLLKKSVSPKKVENRAIENV